jgi:hypothetical protein
MCPFTSKHRLEHAMLGRVIRLQGRQAAEGVAVVGARATSPVRTRHRALRLTMAAVLTAVVWSVLASPASAAPITTKKLIWGPSNASAFNTYSDLGAGLYERTVDWSQVAPTRPTNPTNPSDPAYQWPVQVDEAVANASARGMQVVLLVARTPSWANGGNTGEWAPLDPQDYANFLTAAAKHWPGVHYWQIWGEPSRRFNFLPLAHVRGQGVKLKSSQRQGPRLYSQMLDRAFAALKQVSPANLVIGGSTFSGGDIRPLAYIRAMRLPNGKPPRMDLYGHNPFGCRKPNLRATQVKPGSGVADFSDLDDLAKQVDRSLSGHGVNRRKIPLFLSEYFVPTDHANVEFTCWVRRGTAANWLKAGMKITRKWKRIRTFGWFSLFDDPPNGAGTEVNRGLLTYGGFAKPAYFAYKNG